MSLPVFGKGRPRKPRPLVERTPRICVYDLATSPHPLAREEVPVIVNGRPEVLEVVRDARNYGGDGQRYFLCPVCSQKVYHLYLRSDGERLTCRRCAALTYASRHTRRRGLNRVRNLRRNLGAPPGLLSPVPPRPRYWSRAYHAKLLAELAEAEVVIAARLRDTLRQVRRRSRGASVTDTAIEQRDELIAEALVAGRSIRAVRKEFGLSTAELDGVLERLYPIDTAARLRMIKGELGKLDRLLEVFYAKGLQGDPISAGVAVKIWERKHDLAGLTTATRIDLSIVPPEAPTSYEKIAAAIKRVAEQAPLAQRAIRERVEQLGPERALQLLNAGTSDCTSDSTALEKEQVISIARGKSAS